MKKLFLLLTMVAMLATACTEGGVDENDDSTTEEAVYAIYYTSSDGNVVEPNNQYVFGANIVSNCYKDNQGVLLFDAPVTSIGNEAFRSCASLTTITIPDSVTTIGVGAFWDCSSLTSVTIPDSVTKIGGEAFIYCSSLTSVNITDIAAWCSISFSSFSSNPLSSAQPSYAHNLYLNGKLVTDLVIPDSVTTIGRFAFYECSSLTSITIPDSVTEIGYEAFSGCSSLKEFKGKFAADGGRCLIKDNAIIAYANASGTTYTIPDSVTTIGNYAFKGCSSLTSITIPDSVTEIESYAFWGCSSLTSITIPDSVTTIGEEAFSYCYSLTSVTIGDSVTTIGRYAFSGCDNLTSITIGDSVTTIGDGAFGSCRSLTSVTIGDSVTTIGYGAFGSCSSLKEFKGKFTADGGRCLIKDNAIIAYAEASGTTYTIPDSVTEIGECAFQVCSSLTSITIPDSVTTIGNYAFLYCSSLTSVTIPDSVTTIGRSAFWGCSSLTSVYCKPTTPPTAYLDSGVWNAFKSIGTSAKIYVPTGSGAAYKTASGWKDYASIIEEKAM